MVSTNILKGFIGLTLSLISFTILAQNNGSSCASALELYPAIDCNNASGPNYQGEYQCESATCTNNTMTAPTTAGIDGSCTIDDDATQVGIWLKFQATAADLTITNETDYVGPSAADAEKKDYVVFSGTCGALTEIACNDEIAAGGTVALAGLTAGTTYYIWVTQSAASVAVCPTCDAAATCLTSTVPYVSAGISCASPAALTTNVTLAGTNAMATTNGPICSGSVNNTVWYQWCAPASWPAGQLAYISVYDQICNTTTGLQLTVWNTGATCPTLATDPNVVCQNPGITTSYFYQWTAVASTCYYIALDGYSGTACSYNITVGSTIVLPIELVEFKGHEEGRQNIIDWTTASEINNDYFILERSYNAEQWLYIGDISGAGNSSSLSRYQFNDKHVDDSQSGAYYRLTQVDMDGTTSQEGIIYIKNTSGISRHSLGFYNLLGQPINNLQEFQGFYTERFTDGSSTKRYKTTN